MSDRGFVDFFLTDRQKTDYTHIDGMQLYIYIDSMYGQVRKIAKRILKKPPSFCYPVNHKISCKVIKVIISCHFDKKQEAF